MDLEDRRVTIVMGEDHSAVRVEAVVTGEIGGGILRMETPDPDILDMDGAVVGMEYFYDGIFLRATGELEVKVYDPAPYIFVVINISDPVEMQRRNWVRAHLEVDAVIKFGEEHYPTKTVDISAGGVRLKPIHNDAGQLAVNHGDEVTAVIYLPADDSFRQPAGVRTSTTGTRTSTPVRNLASRRVATGSMAARHGATRTTGLAGEGAGRAGGIAVVPGSASGGLAALPAANAVELPSRILQSDRKVLRLQFTSVSESAAKALTRAVFDAQVAARRRSR